MAHESSTKSNRRLDKTDAPVTTERWKTSPSTEVTSDRGKNAQQAEERRHTENDPQNQRSQVKPQRIRTMKDDPAPRTRRGK